MLEISAVTARRYVMGRGGLWPGRRWRGLDGTGTAMRAMEDLQLDPLVIVARAHDLTLHSRVADYPIDDWATLTYERREFFEWGGWLAVRPMEELPYFRVLMRREREQPAGSRSSASTHDAIAEMRAVLRSGREVSNRDFAMGDRTRIDDYRGRKDSALALHYLWRVGEAMVTRRERFERVYALTEAVAPASALREVDDAEADDVLARKAVAAAGLTRLNGIETVYVYGAQGQRRRAGRVARAVAVGRFPDRGPGRGLAGDPGRARGRREDAGRPRGRPGSGRLGAARDDDRRGGDLPFAARSGQRARSGEAAVRLRLRLGGLQAGREANVRLLHDADPVGRPAGRPVRPEARPDDRHAGHQRALARGRRARPGRGVRRRAGGRDEALRPFFWGRGDSTSQRCRTRRSGNGSRRPSRAGRPSRASRRAGLARPGRSRAAGAHP